MARSPDDLRLSRKEIGRLVYNWIGVDGGYLGNFSYGSHDRFWMETCDIAIETARFPPTRECFIETLFKASTQDQSLALRQILEDYPPPNEPNAGNPKFRSSQLHGEILAWIARLETGEVVVSINTLVEPSDAVRRALDDAETLLRTRGPQSAVDRVHTALHGYLMSYCGDLGVETDGRPTMTQLFKALRTNAPDLMAAGTRAEDVNRMLSAIAQILDALNPVRNNASGAHPNDEIIGEPEAMLVVNTVRTVLNYLEAKRRTSAMSRERRPADV